MSRAYLAVTIDCPTLEKDMAKALVEALSQIPGVKKADPTYGYDAIVVADVADGEFLGLRDAIVAAAKRVTGHEAEVVAFVVRDLGATLTIGIVRVKAFCIREPDSVPSLLAQIPGVTTVHVVKEGGDSYVCDVVACDEKGLSTICKQIREIGGVTATLEVFA